MDFEKIDFSIKEQKYVPICNEEYINETEYNEIAR